MDGKLLAARIRQEVAREVEAFPRPIGLATVLVGDDPASDVYIRMKHKATVEVGIEARDLRLPTETTEDELLALVRELNSDDAIDGILVQLPLPPHVDARKVVAAIDPGKDVDGFHPLNAGRLLAGAAGFVPCTPLGCLLLVKSVKRDLAGLEAVVIGRSTIVGKPMAQLLLGQDCTVTMAHSRTRDLPGVCRRADVLVAAAGRPELVRGDWIKPGAIVIDVGVNRVPAADPGASRIVGDVAFAEAVGVASAITPVPGGVGPMTIACLLRNTLEAACLRRGLAMPPLEDSGADR
jgi:methylenetetrahydrofolate dehydrogenase (NADP+) / methenyltetrahydrofolate cyclohydrolase